MKMIYYFYCFILIVSISGFVSCNKDETFPEEKEGITPALPEDPSRLVTSISDGFGDSGISKFVYDSYNRLICGKEQGYSFDLAFSPLCINMDSKSDADMIYKFKEVTTNEVGYISYMKINIIDNSEEYGMDIDGIIDITYDGDYIKEVAVNYDNIATDYYYFSWNEGNLQRIDLKANWSDLSSVVYTYEEDSPINSGIYLPDMNFAFDFLSYGGYLGKTTAKIPVKCTKTILFAPSVYDISVVYDDKNRIVEYKEGSQTRLIFAYDGKTAVWPEGK